MSSFDLKSSKNAEFVEVTTEFNLNEQKKELILQKLREHKFFEFISSIEIIHSCNEDLESTTIMMKNIVDEYDDELQLLKFSWSFSQDDDKILIKGLNIEVDDDEILNEYFYVDFIDFTIEITNSELKFKMSYDKNRHPSFLLQIIKKCFKIMFEQLFKNYV